MKANEMRILRFNMGLSWRISGIQDHVSTARLRVNPARLFTTEISLQFLTTQSARAAFRSDSLHVVGKAITRAPAALPARMPAGTSSTTTQSAAAKPSTEAALR